MGKVVITDELQAKAERYRKRHKMLDPAEVARRQDEKLAAEEVTFERAFKRRKRSKNHGRHRGRFTNIIDRSGASALSGEETA